MSTSAQSRQPELCVGAVVVENDSLLLIRRGRPPGLGRWSVPGGRVHFGETLESATRREVLEEAGVEVDVERPLGWVERITSESGADGQFHFVIFDSLCRLAPGVAPQLVRAGDDAAEVMWQPLGDLGSLDLVDGLFEFLSVHGVLAERRAR